MTLNTYRLKELRLKERKAHKRLSDHCSRFPGSETTLRKSLRHRYLLLNKYACYYENKINEQLGYVKPWSIITLPA